MKIASLSNPRVKQLVRLKKSRARLTDDLAVIYGVREILRAWESGVVLQEVFWCPELCAPPAADDLIAGVHSAGGQVFEVAALVAEKICFGERADGLVAVFRPPVRRLTDLVLPPQPLLVVVEQVEKPGNLGAILRSCDGAGVDAVLVCDPRTDLYNPNCVRASLGAVFSVPVLTQTNETVRDFLREKQILIVAAVPAAEQLYYQADLSQGAAIVVGSEQNGLSPFWLNQAALQVRIPMSGRVDSLNVSTAAAIVLYEAARQRKTH